MLFRSQYSFKNFLEDMGARPEGRTLDREEKDKGYYKENCRWATPKEQVREQEKLLTFKGETRCIGDWALQTGIKRSTLAMRLTKYNWSVEKALTIGVGPK